MSKGIMVWELGTPRTGMMRTIFRTHAEGYELTGEEYLITAGKIQIELPPQSATILKYVSLDT